MARPEEERDRELIVQELHRVQSLHYNCTSRKVKHIAGEHNIPLLKSLTIEGRAIFDEHWEPDFEHLPIVESPISVPTLGTLPHARHRISLVFSLFTADHQGTQPQTYL